MPIEFSIYTLLCLKVSRHTSIGQSLDMLTARMRTPDGRVDIDAFDMKRYNAIALYKTAYYTIYLPTALAMRMVISAYLIMYSSRCIRSDTFVFLRLM